MIRTACASSSKVIDAGIPYTILDISNEEIVVEEKRVAFNMDEYIEILRQSDQFTKANVWSKIIIRELKNKREYMLSFLAFAENLAGLSTEFSRRG